MQQVDPSAAPLVARAEFERFFDRNFREIARLGYLLSGDKGAAEDLTGDVFLAVWQQWAKVSILDEPLSYVRRMMVNKAASRIRRLALEGRRMALFSSTVGEPTREPDPGAVVDVRAALLQLPPGRRACVVLRHAFDMAEADVARALGISVGTVKSQTSKGMAQLALLLGPDQDLRRSV